MRLEDLGLSEKLRLYLDNENLKPGSVGRVVSMHKNRYTVRGEDGEYDSEVIGKLVHDANDRSDLPAVGDWVSFSASTEGKASIHSILPRSSVLERRAVGAYAEKQIIATNIDFGLIVQAIDRDFSINRIERFLTICRTSSVEPIIVLSKVDLISNESLQSILNEVKTRLNDIPVIAISNDSRFGYQDLASIIEKGKTYCLLGSSGVGKSTLVNNLVGEAVMDTGEIGQGTNRGRHVTSHRELILLANGGIMIDNPGMREVGLGDVDKGLESTYSEILRLSTQCKFNDCKHITEKDCAVLKAIADGGLDKLSYENYTRMQKETLHYQSSVAERRKKGKQLARMIKQHKKQK